MLRNERIQAISRLLYRPNQQWRTCGPMVKRVNREIASQVTIADADFKAVGVKKAQNWKYPGGIIQRHPDLVINGVEYFDPKELPNKLPRRKQESNFFITINTNRAPKHHPADSEEAYQAMEDTLTFMADEATICSILQFGPKDATYNADRYADVIDRVEWKAGVETGEVLERLHCHIWLTVHHYSQIQINRQMTQHVFRREYNRRAPESMKVGGSPYVSVKLLPQSDFTTIMKQYMHKGLTDSAP